MQRTIEVTELVLRDAHQSLLATRMAMEDMIPACEDLDNAGYWSLECWGGATFDACIRFLNEDPWERLRTFRKLLPKSRLQMLLRGQNLLGYRHYEDGVVERFVEKVGGRRHGRIPYLRRLNDLRNLRTSVAAVKKTGKHAQGTICYTVSPVHTIPAFAEMAQRLKEMGCDSICIKDMAGLLKPQPAYDLVKGIKAKCGEDTLVHLHAHATTGVTLVSLMKAIEAGCDIVDTAVSSMSLGAGTQSHGKPHRDAGGHRLQHPAGYGANSASQGALCQDPTALSRVPQRDHRRGYRDFQEPDSGRHDLQHGEPTQRGKARPTACRRCLEEVPRVRQDAGYPPLVTPSSQIVGTQAVFNVLMGKYKVLTGEFADLMLGYYGSTLGEKNPEVLKKAEEHAKKPAIRYRPADLLKPEWEHLRSQALALEGCNGSDEDVLTYAMFPQVAPKFFKTRSEGPRNLGKDPGKAAPAQPPAAAKASGGEWPT